MVLVLSLLVILSTILIFMWRDWLLKYIRLSYVYRNIPCPSGKLPFLGNLLSLPINPHQFSQKLVQCYHESKNADLYCLWIGTYPLVVFFQPTGLDNFLSGPKNITKSPDYDFLHPWLRTGLLTSAGAKWKSRRRIITPAFHDRDLLNSFLDIYNEQTSVFIKRLSQLPSNKPTNLYSYIASCALDIICEAAMGLNVGVQQNKNAQYVDAVLKMTDVILKRQRMPWLWPDLLFRWTPQGREHDRCLKIIHDFTGKVIQDRMNDFEADRIVGKRAAFLDLLLKQKHEENFSLIDIQEEVDTFMFEGHDTTAAAMNFTAFMIASHEKVQIKLHEEIDRVFQGDSTRPCTMEDLDELEYLECVIKETLRLYPSVPFIAREVQDDFEFSKQMFHGQKILRGSTAVLFICFVHRNAEAFPNPDQFNPDRFLQENGNERSPFAFIPFSAGSRNCIGQRFAMLEEKVILSWLLRKFRLSTPMKAEDLRLSFEVILRSENDVLIQVEPRT